MEKIKQFVSGTMLSDKGKDILVVIIVITVGLGCFELGRLSKENDAPSNSSTIENQPADVVSTTSASAIDTSKTATTDISGKNFFASSRGSKYYPLNCPAGKNIKESNKVYFTTGKEAEAAGYTLSSSCS